MMPDKDGLTLCKYLQDIQGPEVIMLTAMDHSTDCVVGLEMGADDYVTKPFIPRVLLARIESSRSRDTGGIGLGLSIVQQNINNYGGKIASA